MNSKATVKQTMDSGQLKKGMRKRARQLIVQTLVIGAIFFLSAGTFRWPGAWAYLAVYVIGIAISAIILLRVNPEVIAERAEVRDETKGWDRVVTSMILVFIVALFVVAGLDLRFGWEASVPAWLLLAA
ncbi:MAG: hypothetical protein JSW55_00665, partial [Chloroflexota bacterium]